MLLKQILGKCFTFGRRNKWKPSASQVLAEHLRKNKFPPWTSYFVLYREVKVWGLRVLKGVSLWGEAMQYRDDDFGKSCYNFVVDDKNYEILRTGCWPFIKYHCSRKSPAHLVQFDRFCRLLKVANLGIPCLVYGVVSVFLVRHTESVQLNSTTVTLYFLLPEDKGAQF